MEKLKTAQIPLIIKLLQENDLPVTDIHDKITFFIEKDNDQIIAVGGIEAAGRDSIIRSIAVSNAYKGRGYGRQITKHLIKYHKETGKRDIYLLTTTAQDYFPKFGFKVIDRPEVPADVKNSSQYKDICPDTAIVMKLDSTLNI